MQGELFHVDPVEPAPPVEKPSPDVQRRLLQQQCIDNGQHPLSRVTVRPLALHAEAAIRRGDPGRKCGNCKFRQKLHYHRRTYPKCVFGYQQQDAGRPSPPPRVSHGAGTDVRAWWPACRDHEWGDELSDDAARWVPPDKE